MPPTFTITNFKTEYHSSMNVMPSLRDTTSVKICVNIAGLPPGATAHHAINPSVSNSFAAYIAQVLPLMSRADVQTILTAAAAARLTQP